MGEKEDAGAGKCSVRETFIYFLTGDVLPIGKNKNALNQFKAFL